MVGGRKNILKKKKMIVVGLQSHNFSREMLLHFLTLTVAPGDSVLAVHVEELDDSFDPNSFHIHEDICKSKQVELQLRVCRGDDSIAVLVNQVRLHFATMLVIGCSSVRPKESTVTSCLKGLPPTCTLTVMDNVGRVLVQKQGISQQGSSSRAFQPGVRSAKSAVVLSPQKSLSPLRRSSTDIKNIDNAMQLPQSMLQKQCQKLATLELKGATHRFTLQELKFATKNFSPGMVIGKGGFSTVYRAKLGDNQDAAVKVLQMTQSSGQDLLSEVEILSGLNHDNIVQLKGFCYSTEMHAMVYNLLQGSLKQNLPLLGWSLRMKIAIGVAKALKYLHHSCSPSIIHRDVKSSNILLSYQSQPILSDFGASMVHQQHQQPTATKKPDNVVGTFGYLAPEYVMYGKVDDKIDVYSYGVVLLELITGKEAIQANTESNYESLVLWARSLLNRGLCYRLIDTHLKDDYNKEEMQRMMVVARLCLMHSSSRRPTMKTILKLLQDQKYPLNMLWETTDFTTEIDSKSEPEPAYVHNDIKSSNVLLNADLQAKIANFGLARSAERMEDASPSSKFVGTRGYMAPEYLESEVATTKIDVYAFGVVILELLTGKNVIVLSEGKELETELHEYIDLILRGNYPRDLALAVAKLSVACLSQDPEGRPKMDEAISTLVRIQQELWRSEY